MGEWRFHVGRGSSYHESPLARVENFVSNLSSSLLYGAGQGAESLKRFVGIETRSYGYGRPRHEIDWRRTAVVTGLLAALGGGAVGGAKIAGPLVTEAFARFVTPTVQAVGPDERGDQPNDVTPDVGTAATAAPRVVVPTESLPPGYDRYNAGNGVVVVQKDGVPVWITLPDGRKIPIDPTVVMQARASGEPEVVDVVSLGLSDPYRPLPPAPSQKKPETKELPADVLSEEALTARGIRIIQSDQTQLFIRDGAFKKGELLADFNGSGRKLTIVLVDGPVVSSAYMVDSKYDSVRGYLSSLDAQIEVYRSEKVSMLNQALEEARKKLADSVAQGDSEHADFLREVIGSYKTSIFRYTRTASVSEIAQEMESRNNEKGGLYAPPRADGTAVIFLAVGTSKNAETLDILVDSEGRISVYQSTSLSGQDERPEASDTHPAPEDFVWDPDASADDPSSYPYRMQTPGQGLRHEFFHDQLIEVGGRNGNPNWSEYDTDMAAMQSIRQAHVRWVNSGFTDNTGYSFVFSLPGGGFILTKEDVPSTDKTFGL